MKKTKKSVNREVRVLEARELMSATGGKCGCGGGRLGGGGLPPLLGQPTFPPPRPGRPGRPGMPPGALGLPSFPPKK